MINLKEINIHYKDKIILKNSEFKAYRKEVTVITGESGSGKTSLLYLLGLISKQKCIYLYDDKRINNQNEQEEANIRKQKIGYLFQDKSLHSHLSIKENLELFARLANISYNDELALSILKEVDLSIDLNKNVQLLSGGQKQRLAIACLLIKNPDILICDEPTSNLDAMHRKQILDLLKNIAIKQNKHVIIATHDPYIKQNANRLYEVKDQSLMLLKEGSNNDQKEDEQPINHLPFTFFKNYSKNFTHSKENYFINVLLSVLIVVLFLNLFVLPSYKQKLDQLLNDVSDSILIVTTNHQQSLTSQELDYINNLDGVIHTYTVNKEAGFGIQINDQFYDVEYTIVPYFKDLTPLNFEWCNQENGIYLSYPLAKQLGITSTSTINIQSDHEITIDGVLKSTNSNYFTSEKTLIYVPYDYFNNNESNQYLIEINHYKKVTDVRDKISLLNKEYSVYSPYKDYTSLYKMMDSNKLLINSFTISLLLIILILSSVSKIHSISNKKFELCILRANGLSKKELIKLMGMVFIKNSIIEYILAVSSIVVLSFIAKNSILTIHLSISSLSILFLFTLGMEFIPSLCTLIYLNQFQVENLLRN